MRSRYLYGLYTHWVPNAPKCLARKEVGRKHKRAAIPCGVPQTGCSFPERKPDAPRIAKCPACHRCLNTFSQNYPIGNDRESCGPRHSPVNNDGRGFLKQNVSSRSKASRGTTAHEVDRSESLQGRNPPDDHCCDD